jgi:hypothetical protein
MIMDINSLFDKDGNCLLDPGSYFDTDGCLEEFTVDIQITKHYQEYPADSDIVKLYYAEKYSQETHGNYSAQLLFRRAYE